jgi:hypothetical protein
MEGGISHIVLLHGYNEMLAQHHPALLARLYAPFLFDRSASTRPATPWSCAIPRSNTTAKGS